MFKRLFVALAFVFLAGCYGVPEDPPAQVAQAGGGPCIGCRVVAHAGTSTLDAAPPWFDGSGVTFLVPGTRCIAGEAWRAYVPSGLAANGSDLWRGFPDRPEPVNGFQSAHGNWVARWVVQPEGVPLNAAPLVLWSYDADYDATNGIERPDTRRWTALLVRRRAEGILFRLIRYVNGEEIPRAVDGRCTNTLFSYFPTADRDAYPRLEQAGFLMDILTVGAFTPFRDGALETRVGRADPIALSPPLRFGAILFSPQAYGYRSSDESCWFVLSFNDQAPPAALLASVATRAEFVRNYFGISGRP